MDELEQLRSENERLKTQLADVMGDGGSYRKLQTELDDLHSKKDAEVQAAIDRTTAELTAKHQAEIAELKDKVLGPAMRDLHARQMADLQAKQQSELSSLS